MFSVDELVPRTSPEQSESDQSPLCGIEILSSQCQRVDDGQGEVFLSRNVPLFVGTGVVVGRRETGHWYVGWHWLTGKEHQLCSHLKWLREYGASAPKCTDGWNDLPTLSGTPPSGNKKKKIDLGNVDLRMNEKIKSTQGQE